MSTNAARRRRVRDERKAASQTPRRPARRSALERNLTVGVYAAFMLVGSLFLLGGIFWSSLVPGVTVAQASGAGSAVSGTAAPGVTTSRTSALPDVSVQSRSRANSAPPQPSLATEAPAQAAPLPLETVPPASTVAAPPSGVAAAAETLGARNVMTNVNITFYDCANQGFCGAMYNGRKVYEGAAACSWNLPIGTRFIIVGDPTHRIYTCEDRGLLANTWVDIFWYHPADGYNWQRHVGRYGTIEIVSMP